MTCVCRRSRVARAPRCSRTGWRSYCGHPDFRCCPGHRRGRRALISPYRPVTAANFTDSGGSWPSFRMALDTIKGWQHRTPDTGHRTPDTGHAGAPRAPHAPVFGLSPEWLLHDGRPIADLTVLSHPEQLARLRTACPEAARTAVLAGDPCYDRM